MNELVERVVLHNTSMKNTVCCIEEMSELTKVLTKKLRNDKKFNRDILLEEVAHVLLMCNAVAAEFAISNAEILEVQKDAVKRMEEEDGVRR